MRVLGISCMLALFAPVVLAQQSVADVAAHKHLGVATCASSVCHGQTKTPKDAKVQMNEFALWQEFDPHAKSYDVLLNNDSKAIARKLGIGRQTLYNKISGHAVDGFTTVILLQLFIGSVSMFGIGMVGEYLASTFAEVKRRPRYLIAELARANTRD